MPMLVVAVLFVVCSCPALASLVARQSSAFEAGVATAVEQDQNVDLAGLRGHFDAHGPLTIASQSVILEFTPARVPMRIVIGSEPDFVTINPITEESRIAREMPEAPEPGFTIIIGTGFVLLSLFSRNGLRRRASIEAPQVSR